MLAWYDGTLAYRVLFGVAFFLTLGLADVIRHPEDPKRAREYVFLLAATLAASAYGVAHDQITVTLSPEYFRHYKGLGDGGRFAVTSLAVQASYWVGAVAGAAMLVANNPGRRPQLGYAELGRLGAGALAAAAGGAVLGGLALAAGVLGVVAETTFGVPPRAGMQVVWGVHLGSYLGGALGVVGAVAAIRRRRGRAAAHE
jgi:hypothetical protein